MSKEKSPEKELKEKLFYNKKNVYQIIDNETVNKINSFSTLVTYGQYVLEPVKISLIKKAISE